MNLAFYCDDSSYFSFLRRKLFYPCDYIDERITTSPNTFVLNASIKVSEILKVRKRKVGIRIINNRISSGAVKKLGNSIVINILKNDFKIIEYAEDPELIYHQYKNWVKLFVDGGHGDNQSSKILDNLGYEFEIKRQLKVEMNNFFSP
tara:strand:+ start:237 stop:680 length:444 start_codon:yes stop_codon:yes gene_type:complete